MKINKWIRALVVVTLVFALAACDVKDDPKEDTQPPNTGVEVEHEVITEQDLPEALQAWYLDKYQQEGLHTEVYEGTQYILIAAGERPTGGYQIINVSLKLVGEKIVVTGEIEGPGEGEMVTQALTYPNVLLKRVADDREFVYEGLTETKREQEIQPESTAFGIYTGMIDQNSVEIQVTSVSEEEFRAFQLSDEAKEQIKDIEDGDSVAFDFETVEGQQDRLLFIQKTIIE